MNSNSWSITPYSLGSMSPWSRLFRRWDKIDSFGGITVSVCRFLGSTPSRQGVNIRKFPATSPAVTITAATCSSCSISIPALLRILEVFDIPFHVVHWNRVTLTESWHQVAVSEDRSGSPRRSCSCEKLDSANSQTKLLGHAIIF